MTFRSFSRFVRWYRWQVLAAGAFVLLVVWRPPVASTTPLAAWCLFWLVEIHTWPKRVLARHRRILAREAAWEKMRLRMMPLRGWTK